MLQHNILIQIFDSLLEAVNFKFARVGPSLTGSDFYF